MDGWMGTERERERQPRLSVCVASERGEASSENRGREEGHTHSVLF